MRSFVSLRLTAQLSLVSAVLCLFAPLQEQWPVFAALPALALCAALFAAGSRRVPVRLVLGLLPALALGLASSVWGLAAGAALAVFTAAFLAAGRFDLERWQYRREAACTLVLCAVIALLSGLGSTRSRISAILCGAGFFCTLLALRAQMLHPGASAVWQARNAAIFALPLAGGAVLGAGLWALLPLLRYAVGALGAVFGGAVMLWNGAWSWLMGRVDTVGEDFFVDTSAPAPSLASHAADMTQADTAGGAGLALPQAELPWRALLPAAGVVALLALMIWLLGRGFRPAKHRVAGTDLTPEPEPEPPRRRRRAQRRRRSGESGSRARIRAAYREYLSFLSANGLRRGPAATTAEISAQAAAILEQTDEPLRALYRLARYGAAEPTEDQARAAEALIARLTQQENLRPKT